MKKTLTLTIIISLTLQCTKEIPKKFTKLLEKLEITPSKDPITNGKIVQVDSNFYKYKKFFKNDIQKYIEEKSNLNHELSFLDFFAENALFLNYEDKKCFYLKDETKLTIFYEIDDYKQSLENYLFSFNVNSKKDFFYWKFDMMFKIATSVKHLHMNKMEHGNINLSSFFMINDFFVVIGDMANVKNFERKTKFLGNKEPYIAPELEKKNEDGFYEFSAKSDIYALAGVFYSILKLEKNFETEKIFESYTEKKTYQKISKSDSSWETISEEEYSSEEVQKKKLIKSKKSYKNFIDTTPKTANPKKPSKMITPLKVQMYKIYEKLLIKMTKKIPKERPNIDQVIIDILKGMRFIENLIEKNKNEAEIETKIFQKYEDYVEEEIEGYYVQGIEFFVKYRDIIMDKCLYRQRVLRNYTTLTYDKDMRELPGIFGDYFRPKTSINNFV